MKVFTINIDLWIRLEILFLFPSIDFEEDYPFINHSQKKDFCRFFLL